MKGLLCVLLALILSLLASAPVAVDVSDTPGQRISQAVDRYGDMLQEALFSDGYQDEDVSGQRADASAKGAGHSQRNDGQEVTGEPDGITFSDIFSEASIWSTVVYIAVTGGEVFHTRPDCGSMHDPMAVTLIDAIRDGYKYCLNCLESRV